MAERLDSPRLNLHGTGLDGKGLPVRPVEVVTPAMWLTAADTLRRVAELGERAGRVFTLENLNLAVDHPGTPFARAADTLALARAVDSPHLRLNLDLYHAQIGEGNLIELVREALPYIGEIQVADVPGRCEPGTGEINYRAVATALAAAGLHRRRRPGGLGAGRPGRGTRRVRGGVRASVAQYAVRRGRRRPMPKASLTLSTACLRWPPISSERPSACRRGLFVTSPALRFIRPRAPASCAKPCPRNSWGGVPARHGRYARPTVAPCRR